MQQKERVIAIWRWNYDSSEGCQFWKTRPKQIMNLWFPPSGVAWSSNLSLLYTAVKSLYCTYQTHFIVYIQYTCCKAVPRRRDCINNVETILNRRRVPYLPLGLDVTAPQISRIDSPIPSQIKHPSPDVILTHLPDIRAKNMLLQLGGCPGFNPEPSSKVKHLFPEAYCIFQNCVWFGRLADKAVDSRQTLIPSHPTSIGLFCFTNRALSLISASQSGL